MNALRPIRSFIYRDGFLAQLRTLRLQAPGRVATISEYPPASEERKSLLEEGKSIYLRPLFVSATPKFTFSDLRKIAGVGAVESRGCGSYHLGVLGQE
jgi:hypothetical protein